MDLKGTLVDTNLKIFPSKKLTCYLQSLTVDDVDIPKNVMQFFNLKDIEPKTKQFNEQKKPISIQLTNKDIDNLSKVRKCLNRSDICHTIENNEDSDTNLEDAPNEHEPSKSEKGDETPSVKYEGPYLTTADICWLFGHLKKERSHGGKDIPYLHELFEGSNVEMPENRIIKRNPILEARCVKLRAQQEAREYRKMTKTVDNVRMRFPEDSISYQLKQLNRQLIAIGQFIISIFAGFLFGFRGVEWMVGNLDFGFRLLLGVMCALVIALAEIYFLAKKLNEELNIPETVQLGGPSKFIDETKLNSDFNNVISKAAEKEHQD